MSDKIPKHLTDRTVWEVQDHIEYARTGEMPVNPEWRRRRDEALADADIEQDRDESEIPLEELDVAGHVRRIRRNRLP